MFLSFYSLRTTLKVALILYNHKCTDSRRFYLLFLIVSKTYCPSMRIEAIKLNMDPIAIVSIPSRIVTSRL